MTQEELAQRGGKEAAELTEEIFNLIMVRQRKCAELGFAFHEAADCSINAIAAVAAGHVAATFKGMINPVLSPEEVLELLFEHIREEFRDATPQMEGLSPKIQPKHEPEVTIGSPNPKSPWAP